MAVQTSRSLLARHLICSAQHDRRDAAVELSPGRSHGRRPLRAEPVLQGPKQRSTDRFVLLGGDAVAVMTAPQLLQDWCERGEIAGALHRKRKRLNDLPALLRHVG